MLFGKRPQLIPLFRGAQSVRHAASAPSRGPVVGEAGTGTGSSPPCQCPSDSAVSHERSALAVGCQGNERPLPEGGSGQRCTESTASY